MSAVELPATPAGDRLRQVLDTMQAGTLDEATLRERCTEPFLQAVGVAQLLDLARQVGPLLEHVQLDWVDAASTATDLSVELAGSTPALPALGVRVTVEAEPPHRIAGLLFRPLAADRPTLGATVDLPGRAVRSRADDGFDDGLATELVAAVQGFVDAGQVGVGAAVVLDDRIWTAEAGVAVVESARPVEASTVFRAYSISKTVTAEAVLALDVDLDAPIGRYLSSVQLTAAPTVRQVLTHTAGVSSAFGHWVEQVVPVAEQLGASWPCDTEPGTAWAYSNGGYALLGQLVEDVAGAPFEEVVADRVLRPLGMTDSEFRPTNAVGDRWAVGYDVRRGQVSPADATVPSVLGAGSLFTTATDLARFAAAVSRADDDGRGRFTSQVPELGQEQGLAWRLGDLDGRTWAAHGGGGHGFSTMLAVLPGAGAGVVLLTNIGGQSLDAPTQALQHLVQSHVG